MILNSPSLRLIACMAAALFVQGHIPAHAQNLPPEVEAALAREGTEVALSKSPDDFAAFLVEDNRFWARLVK